MRTDNCASGSLIYFIGGGCAIALGVLYVAIIAVYAVVGPPPVGTEALLLYLAKSAAKWGWIVWLSVLTDFLFVPVAASLYFALRNVNRYLIFLAAACMMIFVVLDLAITWTNYITAMQLGSEYVNATSDLQRGEILLIAAPIAAILHSKLLFVDNSLTLAIGILLTGIVMLSSTFGRTSAYLAISSGSLGVIAVAGSFLSDALSGAIILASCLTTLWVFILGYRFVRGAMASRAAISP